MTGWLVFYHIGHDLNEEQKFYMNELQQSVQKVILYNNFYFSFSYF